MTGNKYDITINKVIGVPSKFGKDGAHICLPKQWLKETVVVITKKTYEGLLTFREIEDGEIKKK